MKSIRVRTNTLTQLDTDDLSDIRRTAAIILLTPSLLIKNYSFYYLRWRNFTFPSYKSYKISHFSHLYNIQILQKHQITPFLYSVKKSLFLTFYHISVIFDRSIIFIIFLHLPKITIFHLFYKITKNHHFPINWSFSWKYQKCPNLLNCCFSQNDQFLAFLEMGKIRVGSRNRQN